MIGQTISHYRITGQLGSGGMGVVYKAEDTNLDRIVALKFLAPHLLESEEHKQRFLREAKAAASLDHPNICMIHEVGEADGQVFIAMGYIDGPEVRAKIAERPLKLDEALDIAIQSAEGLRAAHQKGVVHRDIKSSNLMLTSTGVVKIMDFGLAQLTGGTRLTKTDTVLGTPAYMSPELAQRLATDKRTDIWSLGVVLYEMLTGRLPFAGEREPAVIYSIIHERHEPITAIRAGVPLELDRIVGKALAKKPDERYQHLDDMLVDLRGLRAGTAAAPPSARRRWLWAALIPVVLGAGLLAWRASRAPEPAEPMRAVPLTTRPGVARYPSLSPDGDLVAFTWTGPKQDNPDIYVQQIGSGSPLRLTTDPGNDYNPVWSPDGRSIAFLRRQSEAGKSELRLIPPLGGPERKLAEIRVRGGNLVVPPYLTWCPDSNHLVVTDTPGEGKPDALFLISLETGEKRQLTHPQPPAWGDINPAVSPDGSWLVFRRQVSGLYSGELYRLPLTGDLTTMGEARRLTPATLDANYLTWMPDSKEILFSARGSLWRLDVTLDQPGESTPARLPFVGEDGLMPVVSRPHLGRPSRLVYVRSFSDVNIWRVETSAPGTMASSPPARSISSTRRDDMAQLSPDGRRVAFTTTRSGGWEIWLADPDGSSAVQLTTQGARVAGYPHWSPGGDRIVFHSNPEGQAEVYVIPTAGGKPRNLTSHPALDSFPSFSRDGQWIYFNSNRTGEGQIWKIPASGGDAVRVANIAGYAPIESPDGAYIYYVETMDKPSPLWRLPVSGGVPVKVLNGVVLASFVVREEGIFYINRPSGDGGVYFADQPSGETRLQYLDFATRRSTTLARNLGSLGQGLTASPDGRTILYSRMDSSVDDLMLVENFR
ncbi:MAG: PD40 domain-containing protein [Acidobacteriia bacterium]|nr:PD40 domain-containing protein [Terriglobia bacterium]